VELQPGDTLVLFSDGVTEAADPDEEMFGVPRLREALADLLHEGVPFCLDGLAADHGHRHRRGLLAAAAPGSRAGHRRVAIEGDPDPHQVVETRLYPDMLPFRFQIQSVAHHSVGAIEGVTSGVFRPPSNLPNSDYAGLQALIASARETLEKKAPETINALEGTDVLFEIRNTKLPFTAAGFLLSFSLPNFYFHATTAYDILRTKGVPLGKRDFMGQMRMKAPA
jgi:hypothetical protein